MAASSGSECATESNFDAVVLGGEAVFRVLKSVSALYSDTFPSGQRMQLRVSGHFGSILTVVRSQKPV
jgi:hypothetical protein